MHGVPVSQIKASKCYLKFNLIDINSWFKQYNQYIQKKEKIKIKLWHWSLPLKTSEKLWFPDVFQEVYSKRPVSWNGLKIFYQICQQNVDIHTCSIIEHTFYSPYALVLSMHWRGIKFSNLSWFQGTSLSDCFH